MNNYLTNTDPTKVLVSTVWGGILFATLFNATAGVFDFYPLIQAFIARSQSETAAFIMALFSLTVMELQLLMLALIWLLPKRQTDIANLVVAILSAALLLTQLNHEPTHPIFVVFYLVSLLIVVWFTWAQGVVARKLLFIAPTVR